jgi:hypothetical protein
MEKTISHRRPNMGGSNGCNQFLNIGLPASVHNERVWSSTAIAQNPHSYFSPGEYLLSIQFSILYTFLYGPRIQKVR